ncbi:MAG: hypothetical protein RL152_1046 [Bacteroidota bacterium]|jgi:hypothetical protein
MKKDLSGKDHLSKFDKRSPAGFPSDKEIPVVLVLKRKAIRVYPDNQKVALYYSQALDKYVSVPFGPGSDLGPQLNESRRNKRDDDSEKTYKALAKDYPEIAKLYSKAKETQPARRAMRRVVGKLTPKEILALPKNERDAAYRVAQERLGTADISKLSKLGKQHNLAIRKFIADRRKDKSTEPIKQPDPTEAMKNIKPKTVSESFRNRVSVLREEQQLDEWVVPALTAAGRFIAGTAAGTAAIEAGKAGMNWASKKVAEYAAKRAAKKAAKDADWVKAMRGKGNRKGRGKGKGEKGSKLDKAADAATIASALAGGVSAGKEIATSAADAATKAGEKYGGGREATFGNIEPKISGPERTTTDWHRLSPVDKTFIKMREETFNSNLDAIRYIVENDIKYHELTFGDKTVSLNNSIAKKVLNLYESLNKQNKKKIKSMLNEDVSSFRKVINFAIRQ